MTDKDVIIPDIKYNGYRSATENIVYTSEALKKYKFKPEYIYPYNIWGATIHIESIEILNKDKKTETVLIKAIHNNNQIAIAIPLRFNYDKKPYSARWFKHLDTEAGTFKVYEYGSRQDLQIPIINKELIDSLNNLYSDRIVYPILASYSINETQKMYEHADKDKSLLLGEPYKFIRIEIDDDEFYRYTISPSIHYLDIFGQEIKFPIRHLSIETENTPIRLYNHKDSPSLENFSDCFITEDEMIRLSESKLNMPLINSTKSEWEHQEVYFDSNNNLSIPKGYYMIKSIKLMSSDKSRPYLSYLASLDNGSKTYYLPIDDNFSKYVVRADIQRNIERAKEEQKRLEAEKREKEAEKEEREYHLSLVRKFGASNARLIEDGAVRLGFTREMCEESWGSPYDKSRVTTAFGSAEAWWYGNGNVLYFNGNKLVMIQD